MKLDIPATVDSHVIIQSQYSHRTWHATLPNGKIIIAFINDPIAWECWRVELTVGRTTSAVVYHVLQSGFNSSDFHCSIMSL